MKKIFLTALLLIPFTAVVFADAELDRALKSAYSRIEKDILRRQSDAQRDNDTESGFVSQKKLNIAVLDFESPAAEFSDGVITSLEHIIVTTGKFTLVDRRKIKEINAEINPKEDSSSASLAAAAKAGSVSGALVVISGKILRSANRYSFNLRAIDVEKASVLSSYQTYITKNDRYVYTAFGDDMNDIEKKLADEKAKQIGKTGNASKEKTTKLVIGGHGGMSLFLGYAPFDGDANYTSLQGAAFGGYVGFENETKRNGGGVSVNLFTTNGKVINKIRYTYPSVDIAALWRLGNKKLNFSIGPYGSIPTGDMVVSSIDGENLGEYAIETIGGILGSYGVMAGITAGIDLGPGMITLNANAICDINKITMQKAGDPSELRRFGITVFAGYELRF